MRQDHQYNDIRWIDLHQPTDNELLSLMHEMGLPPAITNDLATPSPRPTTELHGEFLYTVFHFPAFQHTHKENGSLQEIDFVVSSNTLVTVRYDTIDALHKFSKMAETRSILGDSDALQSSTTLFFALLKKLYKSVYHEIEYAEDWLDRTEDNIFSGQEQKMVLTLSEINRRFLDIRKAIHLHDEQLRSLKEVSRHTESNEYEHNTELLLEEYHKTVETIDHNLALVRELRDTNNSLVSTKQNEIMKTFTVLAFITLPLTVIAGIFNMNTAHMPLVGHPQDFWIVLGIMAVTTLSLLLVFKGKGWL